MKDRSVLFREILFALVLCVLCAISNFEWLIRDHSPPPSDSPSHLHRILEYLHGDQPLGYVRIFLSNHYPPLVYTVTLFFSKIFGFTINGAILSLSVFLFVLFYYLYRIGKRIGDWRLGTIFALCGACPTIFLYSRVYLLDMPATAALAMVMYYLIDADEFRSKAGAVRFGIALAVAFLIKWNLIFFIVAPLVCYAAPAFFSSRKNAAHLAMLCAFLAVFFSVYFQCAKGMDIFNPSKILGLAAFEYALILVSYFSLTYYRKKAVSGESAPPCDADERCAHFSLALLVALALSIPVYAFSAYPVYYKFILQFHYEFNRVEGFIGNLTALRRLFFLSPLFFAVGVSYSIATGVNRKHVVIAVVSLFASAGLVAYLSPFDVRYILPALAFFVIACFAWLARLPALKNGVLAFMVVLSILNIFGWMIPGIPSRKAAGIFRPMDLRDYQISLSDLFSPDFRPSVNLPPDTGDYHIRDSLEAIVSDSAKAAGKVTVAFVEYRVHRVFCDNYMLETEYARFPLRIKRFFPEELDAVNSLEDCRYVIIPEANNDIISEITTDITRNNKVELRVLGRFGLPSGFDTAVYRIGRK